ncbi:MAG: TonB-denpendent receptor [Verrucomicrobia bacterium]|nr:TonB-denpendent receptor [Verrucomicrobiota bacterium]
MHSFKKISLFLFSAALLAKAQTAPAPLSPAPLPDEKILSLDAFVVSSGPDAKTAFDLAQGASILAGNELRLQLAPTLGETLSATPGVNSTYYGPGASRPVIRGLGGDRVRMLDNGVGSLDASNVSPDHNVSVEPLLVERIEVLRGPATLLYGSSAVGGVVNVIDNRIPSAAPATPVTGRTELRFDTASNERTGVLALTAGNSHVAFQLNALRTETDDVSIPGYADPSNPENKGTLANSAISTKSGTLGTAFFGKAGTVGVAVSQYETRYGVPTGEPIEIDMKQRRADFRAEITRPFGPFKGARARFGIADYNHAEVDETTGLPNTTFHNHAYEGRIELSQQDFGNLSGTVGVQTSRSDFSAIGEEVVTPPSLTLNHAVFFLESYKVDPSLTLQFGGRYEAQSIALGHVRTDLPSYPGYSAATGETRRDHGVSLSTGAVYYLAKDYSLGVSVAYSQRIPSAQESFSSGPHGGTNAYEIGTTGLSKESSLGLDVVLRKRAGFITGSVGGFVNRFQNFIFEQRDASFYFADASGTFEPYPVPPDTSYLPIYQFIAKDALFYGGEAELTLHLVEGTGYHLHLDLMTDYVHAEQTTDHQPLPRIEPLRTAVGLHYENERWILGVEARHVFRQDRVAPEETETAGYTLLNASVSRTIPGRLANLELFLRLTNLTNQEARVHSSFLKDVAPLPGRNLTGGVRLLF